MKISMLSAVALVMLAYAVPASAQTGDLKIRFQYAGDAPKQGEITVDKDVEFCGKNKLFYEKLVVNPENKGIKNVVFYVYTGRGGSNLDAVEPVKNTHELANLDCRFDPHVVIAQAGDTLKVTNPDAVGHNANLSFFENTAQNFTVPPNGEQSLVLEKPEPAPIPVVCNIHPWMQAYLVVLDHPYVAASDENGELVIKGIPVGKQTFRVFHEAGSIKEVSVNGKDEEWSRSRVELEIKPGMNDLGTVTVPADALSAQ